MAAPRITLDHILILFPAKVIQNLPKSFHDAFTISPGGTHADNKTFNRLVIFKSGVYLELLAFVEDDAKKKKGHWWGGKTPGTVMDWALGSNSIQDVESVRQKLNEVGSEINFAPGKEGARIKPDGVEIQWVVTNPKDGIQRGSVPFWCHDLTDRQLRVPTTKDTTDHASGALGIKSLDLVSSKEQFPELVKAYSAMFGNEPSVSGDGTLYTFGVQEPVVVGTPFVTLKIAASKGDKNILEMAGGTAGVSEIVLLVDGEIPKAIEERVDEGVLRISFAIA